MKWSLRALTGAAPGLPEERLYQLLPALYRMRDQAQGQPLRALLGALDGELQALEANIDALYDNWFIETCDEWVVPYLADLLGVHGMHPIDDPGFSQRAYVANTLSYRRRKGTPAVLEELTRDVTGWSAKVVEFFRLISATEHLANVRLGARGTVDVRTVQPELLGSPFDPQKHTVDVRPVELGYTHNVSDVGLFVWRLKVYSLDRAMAGTPNKTVLGDKKPTGKFMFSQIGGDLPLFNLDRRPVGRSADEHELPGRLRRGALAEDLLRDPSEQRYFAADRRVLRLFRPDLSDKHKLIEIPPNRIVIADLSGWSCPTRRNSEVVAIDPENGRIWFPWEEVPERLWVSYCYGFSGDIGGGPYDRPSAPPVLPRGATNDAGNKDLGEQLKQWQSAPSAALLIDDSDSYSVPADNVVQVPAGTRLELRATNRERPHLVLPERGWVINLGNRASLILDGVLLSGGPLRLEVEDHSTATVSLRHCTLVEGGQKSGTGVLRIEMDRCMSGPIHLAGGQTEIQIQDSIIDAMGPGSAVSDEGSGTATIVRSTLLGPVKVTNLLLASDSIFAEGLQVSRIQTGGARYCYLPDGSRVPRPYFCQFEIDQQREQTDRLRPTFTSTAYGDPGYAQLAIGCDPLIRSGGSDHGEMGAFYHLRQGQREANLSAGMTEYLRFGLDLGILYVT